MEYRKATIILRELFSVLESEGCSKATAESFLKVLTPICPHITEELWARLGHSELISTALWPVAQKVEKKVSSATDVNTSIVEQVNLALHKTPGNYKKVLVYVMPFEIGKINVDQLHKEIGKETCVYSVADPKKYDPQNKAKKALPGKPSVYLE
jgi:leucyl-tRNA synthetase